MRFLIAILAMIILLLPTTGCLEMITVEDKIKLTSSMDDLMTQVDGFQDVFAEAAAADVINAKETRKRNAKIDEIQDVMIAANEAIKEAPSLIEGVIAANQATAPVNPYAGVIDAVLKMVAAAGIVTTGVSVNKIKTTTKEKKTVDAKYKAFKHATDEFRVKHPETAAEHYEMVGKERVSKGIV